MSDFLSIAPNLVNSFDLQKGMVYGLLEQPTESSPCQTSLEALQTTFVSSQYQLQFDSYAGAVFAKGNTPTDTGFLLSMFEFLVDVSLVGFNFYNDCKIELLLIVLGSFLSKTSSAYNFGNNISYVLYNGFSDYSNYFGADASVPRA